MDLGFFRAVAAGTLRRRPDGLGQPDAEAAAASVVEGWRAAPPAQRRRLVLAHVAGRARHVLGQRTRSVRRAPALKEVGLDSLMAVELRNVLTRSLGTSLPATLLFDHPSLDALDHLPARALDLEPDADPTSRPPTATPLAARRALLAMSDEEAEALLLAELGEPGGAP